MYNGKEEEETAKRKRKLQREKGKRERGARRTRKGDNGESEKRNFE